MFSDELRAIHDLLYQPRNRPVAYGASELISRCVGKDCDITNQVVRCPIKLSSCWIRAEIKLSLATSSSFNCRLPPASHVIVEAPLIFRAFLRASGVYESGTIHAPAAHDVLLGSSRWALMDSGTSVSLSSGCISAHSTCAISRAFCRSPLNRRWTAKRQVPCAVTL